ncbi:HAD-IIIC family phosphatase [Fictibacillus nanhaiensis]|uniref:HAD-IIIC family phosphatase n=1 Tax=Fictibacillus nanhaiensis TaxID=742169 RepID=UPI003C266FAF
MITEVSTRKIKCVIWDLDNTVWNGTLLEDSEVTLRTGVVDIIKELDQRGILQSISSKNDYENTMKKLKELQLDEFFIYPEINWNAKSGSIEKIVKSINIGMDTIAFIDDQPFEREEVNSVLPEVLTIDAAELSSILEMDEMNPTFITSDSKNRRKMYMSDIDRKKIEDTFEGPQEEFLASLQMKMVISPVELEDLQRAEELTVRTNQLNTTGYTYSYEELAEFRKSPNHKLFIVELEDKYGSYGKIGLLMVEVVGKEWWVKLLLMSCRVMSRGVGSVLITHLLKLAASESAKIKAEFVETSKNRMMYLTYKFAGFKEAERNGNHIVFEHDYSNLQDYPEYVEVIVK